MKPTKNAIYEAIGTIFAGLLVASVAAIVVALAVKVITLMFA